MSDKTEYAINMQPKFDYLQTVDIPTMVEACEDEWFNQTLCLVNDSAVRLGILHGEFHWHKHDLEDEFFLVLDGQFHIDLEDRQVVLGRHQGFTIPKGVLHRTRAPQPVVVLMVEPATVTPTGDD